MGFEVTNELEAANNVHLIQRRQPSSGSPEVTFNPTTPEAVLATGRRDSDRVLSLVYLVEGQGDDVPPVGFPGGADVWHHHEGDACLPTAGELGPADEPGCLAAGFNWIHYDIWMLHVWVVPGVGNPDGVFAAENPCLETGSCPSASPIPF